MIDNKSSGAPPAPAPAPEKNKSKERSARLRRNIEANLEQQKEILKNKLFRQRLELARIAVKKIQDRQAGEAVKALHGFLRILADSKGVPVNAISPQLFDLRRDLPELLLLSGVYWDLAKLYDRTRSKDKRQEFMHYLEKFIVFTKGMSFQPLAAETLRKYVMDGKPLHRSEFRNAYRALSSSKCFVATALVDVTDERTLPRLRKFRDEVMAQNRAGRFLTGIYYKIGPALAETTDRMPNFARKALGRLLDRISGI